MSKKNKIKSLKKKSNQKHKIKSTATQIQKNIQMMKPKHSKHQYLNQHIEVVAEKTVNHRLFLVVRQVKIEPIKIIHVKIV